MENKLKKFYLKDSNERLRILNEVGYIKDAEKPFLSIERSSSIVENHIFNYEIPLGVALNFNINGKDYIVPMATEEPSVIAAASNGAKVLSKIEATCMQKNVIGQIVLHEVKDVDFVSNAIIENKEIIIEKVKRLTTSMIKRGGGPRNLWLETFKDGEDWYVSMYLSMDTVDAMGANTINTVLEDISEYIEEITKSKFLMRIISNNAIESIVKARAEIDIGRLSKDREEAKEIAKRIHKACLYANLDKFRAVTHNKGIMNGIDAVLIATGNDFRAVEASCHAYAIKDNKYGSLTKWIYNELEDTLEGSIEIPMSVATVGGTINANPMAKWSLELLGNPNAKELAQIIASVGLSQNFSAIRAIVTSGIQKGHMSLHARSLASQAGANEKEVETVVNLLKKQDKINLEKAVKLLQKIRNKESY